MKVKPSDKLKELVEKYDIPVDVALALGGEAVDMAQQLFEKWKNNFTKQYKKQTL